MADEFKSLADSVVFALMRGGTAILDHPQQLLSYLADTMDPDGMEMRVLMRCCDDQLIEPYRKALGNGSEALSTAESRARDHLINECMIEPRTAAAVSMGIARGIAMRFGTGASGTPSQQPPVAPQPQVQTPAQESGWSQPGAQGTPGWQGGHTVVVTPSQQVQQPQVRQPQYVPQPQPQQVQPQQVQPQPAVQPAPQPQPAVQPQPQQVQQPKKKSPLPIIAAVAAVVVAAVLVLPRLLGGGGSTGSSRGGVFPSTSEDEGIWLMSDAVTVDEDGTVTNEWHDTFDSHGNLLTSNNYGLFDDGTFYRMDYTYSDYDEYGYENGVTYKNSGEYKPGDPYESTTTVDITNQVDSSGRVTERWTYNSYESGDYTRDTDYHYTYTYDGNTLTQADWEMTEDSYTLTGTRTYDEYGHQISYSTKSTWDDGDTSTSESTHTYELKSDGTPISEVYVYSYTGFDGVTKESRTEYTYDENGNLVKMVETDEDGKVETEEYTYELDSNGNFKTRTNLTTGEVTTFTYTYISDPSFAVSNSMPRDY